MKMEHLWNFVCVTYYLLIFSSSFHPTSATRALGSCDFEEYDISVGNNLCGYEHGAMQSVDVFKWELKDDGENHYMGVITEDHPGQKARLYSVEIKQQDTHCFTFDYHLEGGAAGNDTISPNLLNVYVLDAEDSRLKLPVWNSTLGGDQTGWTTVQLALNPRAYQVVFEAVVEEASPGVIALDNIIVDTKACVSTPHFLRVGNKEVNAGQDVTLRCLLWGQDLEWWERNETSPIVLQKYTEGDVSEPSNEEDLGNHLSVEFMFPQVGRESEGRYRCVFSNATSVGVSNFAKVTVKIPPVPQRPPEVKIPGSTRLLIHLNNESFVGDKPIIQTILGYRPVTGSWSELHEITTSEYLLYHLQPDTKYEIRVTLVRPGPGGMGSPGPKLITKTHCGPPLRAVQKVKLQPIASSEIKIMWEVPDFSITQCHYHSYLIKYRKYTSSNESSSAVRFDTLRVESGDFGLVTGLDPFTVYEIKIELINSNGSIETGAYTMKTGEGVPGPIPRKSFIVTHTNETAISLKWNEPKIANGVLEGYEVAFRGMSSLQPDFTPQQDHGIYQVKAEEHNVTIHPLHPGTNYTLMIRAQTAAGFGPRIETSASTKIAAPKMGVYPSPTPDDGSSSTPTTIEIEVLPAEANGAPISFYYIIIEEVSDEAADLEAKSARSSRTNRKRKKSRKRQKRDVDAIFLQFVRVKRQTVVTTTEEAASPCHSEPISYEDAKKENKSFYFGGKLNPESVTEGTTYNVGGGKSSGGFSNPPLDPNKKYKIYVRVDSEVDGETKVNCVLVAIKASVPPTTPATTTPTTTPTIIVEVTKDETNPTEETSTPARGVDADKVVSNKVVTYASIGGGVLLLMIVIIIIVVVLKLRKGKMKHKDEVVNPFEVRMMMSDVGNHHSMQRSFGNPDRQALMMPDVVDFENHDFMEKTLDASGTRVSDTFQSGTMPLEEDRPALRVDDFHIHVNDLKRQNNFGFHEEFTSFREGQQAPWDVGKREENRVKNRYGNIMAYDRSRVVLQPIKGQEDQAQSDYINANYIMGYKNPQMYIATQAPSADTVNDFWAMIWQEKCAVIVMVTNLVELGKRKCHKYWPDETAQFGSIKVSLSDTDELSDYTIRTFVIQQNDGYDAREIKQFHFTSWPDHGVPSHPTSILSFVRRIKSYYPPGQGPTIVHCSAGSGRTGCFIVIDMMLDMARDEGVIDIYNTVTDLRRRRVNMVQTEEQYIFIHDSVLEALLCGDTLVAAQELRQHYDDLITVDQHTQIAPVQEEFETLNLMTPKLTEEECSVARLPRNRQRNRFMDVLPADRQMPYLVTPHPTDPESNYINAIFADSYSKRNAFIITQMPLPNTVVDFWRLIYDYNCSSLVMMNDASEHDQTCSQYWPDNGSALFGPFTVELVQKEDEVDVVSRLFKLQNINRPSEGFRFVQQFQLTNWPATQPVPYTRNAVLRVIQLVTKWQDECSKHGEGRILVHCVAGAGRSGTFVACYNLCLQLRRENFVDVFNIVQRMRNVRPQLVETLEQYRFCYEVGWDFADQ